MSRQVCVHMGAISKPGQWVACLPNKVFVRVRGNSGQGIDQLSAARADLVAFLGALCLFLSAIEYMIPKPIPFLRVGIANLPILLSLDLLPGAAPAPRSAPQSHRTGDHRGDARILRVPLLRGRLLCQRFRHACRAAPVQEENVPGGRRGPRALFSNAAQILMARWLIFGEGAWLIAPPFLAIGTVTAVVLGLFAEQFLGTLAVACKDAGHCMSSADSPVRPFMTANVSSRALFLAGALLFPAFLLQQDIVIRALQIALFLGLNLLSGKRIRVLQYVVVEPASWFSTSSSSTAGARLRDRPPDHGRRTEERASQGNGDDGAHRPLSQFFIRSDLRLPGRIGGLIGRSLFYFEKIMGERRRIERKDIGSIDTLLLEIHAAGTVENPGRRNACIRLFPGGPFLCSSFW